MNYGLPLPQAKASDTSQPTGWQVPLVQRSAMPWPCYMHSVDVTQYHHLLAGEKGLWENIQQGHPSILHLRINSGFQLC